MSSTGAAALQRLDERPRQPFAFTPTPLEAAPGLARALGLAAPLLLKRDDYTGFGFGGNKVRKLEYVLAEPNIAGVDAFITVGGAQSNHARVTAACAASLGRACFLVLNGVAADPPRGNALLQRLYGAHIEYVGSREQRTQRMATLADELRAAGRTPLEIPLGASTPEGALGYVRAAVELDAQLRRQDVRGPVTIVISASSCGTLAGLLLGISVLERHDVRLMGVSADESEAGIRDATTEIAHGAAALLGYEGRLLLENLEANAGFTGPGYGIPTPESEEALQLFASHQGCVLDPVYSAKAAAGLVATVRSRRWGGGETVIFWHTGGTPAIFL